MSEHETSRIETTYEWTCSVCDWQNKRVDDTRCQNCGKELADEKCLRHRRLTPAPMRIGVLI